MDEADRPARSSSSPPPSRPAPRPISEDHDAGATERTFAHAACSSLQGRRPAAATPSRTVARRASRNATRPRRSVTPTVRDVVCRRWRQLAGSRRLVERDASRSSSGDRAARVRTWRRRRWRARGRHLGRCGRRAVHHRVRRPCRRARRASSASTASSRVQAEHGFQYWPAFLPGGELVGCAGLRPYRDGVLELGVHLRPAHWRRGYADELGRAVIAHAFALGARTVRRPSPRQARRRARMLAKLGFRYAYDELYPPTALAHPSYLLERPA